MAGPRGVTERLSVGMRPSVRQRLVEIAREEGKSESATAVSLLEAGIVIRDIMTEGGQVKTVIDGQEWVLYGLPSLRTRKR